MNKKKIEIVDNKYYLLGEDDKGKEYWLTHPCWDSRWYWGLGYVKAFDGYSPNTEPHRHFDNLFLNGSCCYDKFCRLLPKTPLSSEEIWKLMELMKFAYAARNYSDATSLYVRRTLNGRCEELIQEYKRITDKVIPGIMDEVYKLLTP